MADLPPDAPAIVTDVHVRSPLHGLRGLGRAGIGVIGVADRRSGAGLWSRYTGRRAFGPSAAVDPAAFRAMVARLAESHGPCVIFPGNEAALDALVAIADWVPSGSVLASPEASVLERLRDKAALGAAAAAVGLRVPETVAVAAAGSLRDTALPVPCVVKPTRPNQVLPTARVLSTSAELRALLEELPAEEMLLVQQVVSGSLHAVALVLDRAGGTVASFQQVALRTSPPEAGVSALAISVAPDRDFVDRSAALLRSVGFWGLAQLQFVGGRGRPALIDVNPRFFGSLSLSAGAGLNLPMRWHEVARGETGGRPAPYRAGVRYRWLEAEIGLARRRGISSLRPVPRPVTGGIWASDDPVPSALLAAQALAARTHRLPARLRG